MKSASVYLTTIAQFLFLFLFGQLVFNPTTRASLWTAIIEPLRPGQKVVLLCGFLVPFIFASIFLRVAACFTEGRPKSYILRITDQYPMAMFVAYAVACALLALIIVGTGPNSASADVSIIAALLAVVGVVVQQASAASLHKKQHTMNVLLQFRQSDLVQRHRTVVSAKYPTREPLTSEDVSGLLAEYDRKDSYTTTPGGALQAPAVESVYYMTNYFEYIAAAIHSGDLDERLINETIGGHIRSWYRKYRLFIEHNENLSVRDGLPRKAVFINLWILINKKSFQPVPLHQRLLV
jgi:hypothetical protein